MKYNAVLTKAIVLGIESPVIYKGEPQDYEKANVYQGSDVIPVSGPIGTFKVDLNKKIDIPVICNHFKNSNGYVVNSIKADYKSDAK
jgi:hypothetical protein